MDHPEHFAYNLYHQTRKTRLWRFAAFAILIGAIVTVGAWKFSEESDSINSYVGSDYVAEIKIEGMIIDAQEQAQKISELAEDKHIKAVLLAINSPGGTTYDSEIIYNALREVAEKKLVVAYMQNMAASGGYITALGADHIISGKNTITGSIGVLMQMPNAHKLMENIGISLTEVKSSKIKGGPNIYTKTPPEVLNNLRSMIEDTNDWFRGLVRTRRKDITKQDFEIITDGRVVTGQQALNYKLVDAIGGRQEAQDYIIKKQKLDEKITFKEVTLKTPPKEELIRQLLGQFMGALLPEHVNILQNHRNNVDGLLSLWHS